MPLMNGLELLKKVKELNPYARTILVSASELQDNPDFQKYLKEGVIDSFIQKPITVNRLCQRVRDEVGIYHLSTDKARPQIKKKLFTNFPIIRVIIN